MQIKQAVILAGGLGTRMREESEFKPKPMVEVGEKPILEHIIRHFVKHGVEEIVILLGYKGDVIRDHFIRLRDHSSSVSLDTSSGEVKYLEDSEFPKCQITFVNTGLHSLTGERIRRAKKYLATNFFLTYGDGISDVDLKLLESTYSDNENKVVITVTKIASKYGVANVDARTGKVLSFSEKPDGIDLINMGYFVMSKEYVDEIPANSMLEHEFLQNLIIQDKLFSFTHRGFFAAIDTPRDLQSINLKYKEGELDWLI